MGGVYWWSTVSRPKARPSLVGGVTADLCVVGGGYAGLWTAIEFKQRFPDAGVVLLDAAVCGSGASGRNGGWATSYWRRFDELVARFGLSDALWLADAAHDAVNAIGEFVDEHHIACGWRQKGGLLGAASAGSMPWQSAVTAIRSTGKEEMLRVLEPQEARALINSPALLGGAVHTDTASVNPVQLALGMRQVAIDLGVEVYEGSAMQSLVRSAPAVVSTATGWVESPQVVLALGAWASVVSDLRRSYVAVGSNVIATEPLGDAVRHAPWADGTVFGDDRISSHYAQVTEDGRIVFGRALGALGYANRVTHSHEHHRRTEAEVVSGFRHFFPQLRSARITHSWGGAVDRTPHAFPTVGQLDDAENIRFISGFSGQGVAQSRLLARMAVAGLAGSTDRYASNPLVGSPPQYFPPEPFRYIGGNVVKTFVAACEKRRASGASTVVPKKVLKALVGAHVPAAIEPRRTHLPQKPNQRGGRP